MSSRFIGSAFVVFEMGGIGLFVNYIRVFSRGNKNGRNAGAARMLAPDILRWRSPAGRTNTASSIAMRIVLVVQGLYYVVTGVWPIVSMQTFEAVTGPKTDDWLVQMVGLLAASIGITLLVHTVRQTLNREAVVLSVVSAISFASIDVIYSLKGTISKIYLADGAIQIVVICSLAAGYLLAGMRSNAS
jgi:hypothetical protein